MRADGTDAYREWTAAYALGALDPHERREFETHLVGGSHCAAAVSEFAALPAMLSTVPYDEALAVGRAGKSEAPTGVLSTLADKIRRRRR